MFLDATIYAGHMLPSFLDHLDMVSCNGMGAATKSTYQHDTLDIISGASLLEAVRKQ